MLDHFSRLELACPTTGYVITYMQYRSETQGC